MFDIYLEDAYEFYEQASHQEEDNVSKRLYRASIFTLISAVESYVNYVSSSFEEAKTLEPYEEAFLTDKKISFEQNKVVLKTEFYYLEQKIKFLLCKFNSEFDFNNVHWQRFVEVKKFRNKLVHPKNDEDVHDKNEYRAMAKDGLSGIVNILNEVNKAIYSKPMRRQILDLIPSE